MEKLIDEYNQCVNNAKLNYIKQLKQLYPTIYLLKVFITHDYGSSNELVACFTNEYQVNQLIGTGKWGFYCSGEGSENYLFKIIPIVDYDDLEFKLLINIDKPIDMSYFGKMV